MTWTNRASGLHGIDATTRRALDSFPARIIPAGTALFHPGDAAQGFVIVLRGRIEVFLVGQSGREVLLYIVDPGDTCVQTTLGLLGGDSYTAEGVVASECEVVLVPRDAFLSLMRDAPAFAAFVFRTFASRMQDLMQLLDKVAFQRIESRLAQTLLDLADGTMVHATHQDLASRIGTAREVISRRLETFARDGLVETERGTVRLTNIDALRHLAAMIP